MINIRPPSPAPGHIWAIGNYIRRGGQYIYVDGYWAKTLHKRHHWVDGKWKHKKGWVDLDDRTMEITAELFIF